MLQFFCCWCFSFERNSGGVPSAPSPRGVGGSVQEQQGRGLHEPRLDTHPPRELEGMAGAVRIATGALSEDTAGTLTCVLFFFENIVQPEIFSSPKYLHMSRTAVLSFGPLVYHFAWTRSSQRLCTRLASPPDETPHVFCVVPRS